MRRTFVLPIYSLPRTEEYPTASTIYFRIWNIWLQVEARYYYDEPVHNRDGKLEYYLHETEILERVSVVTEVPVGITQHTFGEYKFSWQWDIEYDIRKTPLGESTRTRILRKIAERILGRPRCDYGEIDI